MYFCDVYGSPQGFWYYKPRPSFNKNNSQWFLSKSFQFYNIVIWKHEAKTSHKQQNSSSEVVIGGVTQDSIDWPLLFNLLLHNLILFLYTTVLSNYIDDNNLYVIVMIKKNLKESLSKKFRSNWLVLWELYDFKCHKTPLYAYEQRCGWKPNFASFEQKKRIFRKEVDILGITAYEKLSFHKHIKNICRLPKAKWVVEKSPHILKVENRATWKIEQLGKRIPSKSSEVNLQRQWKKLPNITKRKQ